MGKVSNPLVNKVAKEVCLIRILIFLILLWSAARPNESELVARRSLREMGFKKELLQTLPQLTVFEVIANPNIISCSPEGNIQG